MSLVLVLGDYSAVCNWLDRFGEKSKNIFVSSTQLQLKTNTKVHYVSNTNFTSKFCDAPRNTVIIGDDLNPETVPEYLMKFVINGYLKTFFENIDWIVITKKETIATLVLKAQPHVVIAESNQFKKWYGPTKKYADLDETLVVFDGQVLLLADYTALAKIPMTMHCIKNTPLSLKILKYAQNNLEWLELSCDITFEVYLDVDTMPAKSQGSLLALVVGNTWITEFNDIVNYLEAEFKPVSLDKIPITISCIKDKHNTKLMLEYLSEYFDQLNNNCDITINMVTKIDEMPSNSAYVVLQHNDLIIYGFDRISDYLNKIIK